MYDTRWPRPGPAMAAVGAVVGLLVGVALGLTSPASVGEAEAGVGPRTSARATTTLPEEFYTVVLGSFGNRENASSKARELRAQGVDDARVLRQSDYSSLGTEYAVYSGLFRTSADAEAHLEELAKLGVTNSFWKHVTR